MKLTLEDVIRRNVPLSTQNELGWFPVLHTACDHGRKGKRAGFKFNGDSVWFNCFNCALGAAYTPSEHPFLSENMRQVMDDFLIPASEYRQVVLEALKEHPTLSSNKIPEEPSENLEPPEIPLPDIFYKLSETSNSWATLANQYLKNRGIDPNSYPFMLARKSNQKHLKDWFGRLIIPIYKNKKLIFYLGRDLTSKVRNKYEFPSVSRDNIIYGYDRLFTDHDSPLYVVEGWFDAQVIDGVAIFGNKLNDSKIKILNKSPRKKVYIPDRTGNGIIGAEQALEAGWAISTPNIGNCKDMNEAVVDKGQIYVLKTLAENTSDDPFTAYVKLKMFCE